LDENATDAWYRHWIDEGFRAFEATLTRDARSGQFCLGDQITIADICLVPQVANARRFNCDLSTYPRTLELAEAAMRLPAFQRAEPTRQADAF
jgi:maleylacetoacetate isomerase